MKHSNQQTISAYETHAQEYIEGTPQVTSGEVKVWLDGVVKDTPKTAKIIEIGSAFGRDAEYLQNQGFTVECTDATQAFVDILNKNGFKARQFNILEDSFTQKYDLVLANAVLLHFTREETAQVLRKVYDTLNSNGTFAFTLKEGEGEEWSDRKLGASRYFCYWQSGQIKKLLRESGFDEVEVGSYPGWLHITARRS